jgi:tetratricopeptide (TPR) repeat protein
LPAGYGQVELPFGILTNIPLVWFAAAVPLSWRGRAGQEASKVRLFAAAVAWLFVACALPLVFFSSAIVRYEVDFTPALVLLAVIGLLGLERATAPTSEAGQVAKSLWRRDARWGWGALLSFSVAFNLLASAQVYAGRQCAVGVALAQRGRLPEAILSFRDALRINPDFPAAHDELGRVLERSGQAAEAVEHNRQAVRLRPDYATAQVDLGNALLRVNNLPDAITHYEQALQHRPDYANAHNNLGVALARLGQMQEAVGHWEQAVRIDPDYAEAHCNLGVALAKAGRIPEGIEHLRQALRINPDYVRARDALAQLQARQ